MTWRVRHEGSPAAVTVPSAQRVLEGLRDGEWEPTDEVRGPADPDWVAIADHPQFADAAAEVEAPRGGEPPDESRLDMNPLIDVSLVLLIFFVLTASYSSLRRAIELPPAPTEAATPEIIKPQELKDRVFKVKMSMGPAGKVVIEIEGRGGVSEDDLEVRIKDVVKSTGRKEMFADVTGDVPWGVEAKLYDAAKAADVHQIYWPKGK